MQKGVEMTRFMTFGVVLAFSAVTAACAGNEVVAEGLVGAELGVIPIGGVPRHMHVFVASDCEKQQPKFSDCSAQDAEGRRYAFFGGALSKVSAAKSETGQSLHLPAALQFGEDIELAAEKVSSTFGVKLDRANLQNGRAVYSSDFVVRSSAGVLYSIELIADEDGHLVEIVERTDF